MRVKGRLLSLLCSRGTHVSCDMPARARVERAMQKSAVLEPLKFESTTDDLNNMSESRTESDPIGGNSSSTERWYDVPRGTMVPLH